MIKRRCYGILNVKHLFQHIHLDTGGYSLFDWFIKEICSTRITKEPKIKQIKRNLDRDEYTIKLLPPSGVDDITDARLAFVSVKNACKPKLKGQSVFTLDEKIGISLIEGDSIVVVGIAGKFLGMTRKISTGNKGTIILLLTKDEYEDRKDILYTKAREISPGVAAVGSCDLSLLDSNVQLLNGLVEAQTATPTHTGAIFVSSSPSGAFIYVNGVYTGTTPLTVYDIPEGSYTVKLVKSGYEDCTRIVRVTASRTTSISCDLTRIRLLELNIVNLGVIGGIVATVLFLLSVFVFYRKRNN